MNADPQPPATPTVPVFKLHPPTKPNRAARRQAERAARLAFKRAVRS